MYRKNAYMQWTITVERLIGAFEQSLDLANSVLWNTFGINPHSYSDNFAEIKRCHRFESSLKEIITIYTVELKAALAFQIKPEEQFVAIPWKDLLNDVMHNSVYAKYNSLPKHTPRTILVAQALNTKGIFE